MPLEEEVSIFLIFWSTLIYQNGERKTNDIPQCPLELPANQHSQFDSPELGWAKSALLDGWVTPKAIMGCHFFSLPTFVNKSKPKYQKNRNLFFKRHLKLI